MADAGIPLSSSTISRMPMLNIAEYFPITDPTLIFFVVLLIILFAPIIMGKLRIPHIIGMVLAGILVGKYGLNILERDASFELFGKVGLYYIMFLAALEMDMEGMKKNKSRLIIYGLLTCFVPFFLTFGMSIWLLHYSTRASFLLSCIMASNTLIAYPIVSRYGLQQKPSVTLSVRFQHAFAPDSPHYAGGSRRLVLQARRRSLLAFLRR